MEIQILERNLRKQCDLRGMLTHVWAMEPRLDVRGKLFQNGKWEFFRSYFWL